jgi:acyl-CoA thioesterase YciA
MSDPSAPTDSSPDVGSSFPSGTMPAIRRVMVPQDTNAMGTVFGGAILSDIDLAAAIAAHREHPGTVVTVAMDKVEFKKPVFVGDIMTIFADTVHVGRSSITVKVHVWAQRRLGCTEPEPVTEALVTMVAVDEDLHPIPVSNPC